MMMRAFTPRSVDRLRPFLVEQASQLIDELLPLGACEFIDAYARRLPSVGLCELIGVPLEDRSRFSEWADTIGYGFNVMMLPTKIHDVDAAITQLLAYCDELIAICRASPRDDLVTRIAHAIDEEKGIDDEQIRMSLARLKRLRSVVQPSRKHRQIPSCRQSRSLPSGTMQLLLSGAE